MKFFKLTTGIIVTLHQKDKFEKEGYLIKMIPAHEFLTPHTSPLPTG